MVILKCIGRERDVSGVIKSYLLVDGNGKKYNVASDKLKDAMRSKKINVINLTLTSDNRLVSSGNKKNDQSNVVILRCLGLMEYDDGKIQYVLSNKVGKRIRVGEVKLKELLLSGKVKVSNMGLDGDGNLFVNRDNKGASIDSNYTLIKTEPKVENKKVVKDNKSNNKSSDSLEGVYSNTYAIVKKVEKEIDRLKSSNYKGLLTFKDYSGNEFYIIVLKGKYILFIPQNVSNIVNDKYQNIVNAALKNVINKSRGPIILAVIGGVMLNNTTNLFRDCEFSKLDLSNFSTALVSDMSEKGRLNNGEFNEPYI